MRPNFLKSFLTHANFIDGSFFFMDKLPMKETHTKMRCFKYDPSFTSFHTLILLLALFFWQTSPTPFASLAAQNIYNQGYLSLDSNPSECLTNLVLLQCLKHLIYVSKCKHQIRAEDIVTYRWTSHSSEKQLARWLFCSDLWLCPRHE